MKKNRYWHAVLVFDRLVIKGLAKAPFKPYCAVHIAALSAIGPKRSIAVLLSIVLFLSCVR